MLGRVQLPPPPCALNITSLVDIMLVVVMYLLMVFATSSMDNKPLSDIELPESRADALLLPGVKVSVSASAVRVANQPVPGLTAAQLAQTDEDSGRRIMPLFHALERERLRSVTETHTTGEQNLAKQAPGLIYLEASKGLPYGAIDRVLKTASAAGFDKFRLVISHRQ